MSTPHVKFCRFSGLLCCSLPCAHLISPQNFCTFHRTKHRAETGRPLSGERQSFLLTWDGWLLSECDESIGKESINYIFQTLRGISLHSRTNQSSREHLLQMLSGFLPRLRYKGSVDHVQRRDTRRQIHQPDGWVIWKFLSSEIFELLGDLNWNSDHIHENPSETNLLLVILIQKQTISLSRISQTS